MSIRRMFQIVTLVLSLIFAFGATGVSNIAYGCDPQTGGGLC